MTKRIALIAIVSTAAALAQQPFTPGVKPFIAVDAPVIAIEHVRVLDGTGAPAQEDQTIVIDHGRIQWVGASAQAQIPAGTQRLDRAGHTVIPGLVGMHEHLFYPSFGGVPIYIEHGMSFPRLYLASGVTTARTAGTLEPYTDLNLKKMIDEGRMPGPKMLITVGYLEGHGSFAPQMAELNTPDDARRFVEYWASMGAHSFKAYMHITRGELESALTAAHARGLKITGHLCSVGFREAAALGIDNLEHGLVVDSEFNPNKQPDVCPTGGPSLAQLDINSDAVQRTIRELVQHKVAVTSTLAVFESAPPLQNRFLDALSPTAAVNYLSARDRLPEQARAGSTLRVKKEVEFERAFVKAGGLLMAGCDPTGNGSALAGFGDQRNVELLVEGGFTAAEAVQIATLNGAKFLGLDGKIGSIAAGKQADLVLLDGNPAKQIADIEKVSLVFKDGVGYDPAKLLQSVHGRVGMH
ncbi:MAG TPA: amidohydrolase family protein [Bryobacteraceae bacterium]|nr:amidohydrolase family protein [Bryobacteraceae bacterium]